MDLDVPVLHPDQPRAVRLMNSIWADRSNIHDSLESLAHLELWAPEAGLGAHGSLGEHDLGRTRALRDALRRLAADATEDDRPHAVDQSLSVDAALAVLNEFMTRCTPVLRHTAEEGYARDWVSGGTGFQHELALLALEGAELLTQPGANELRACAGPGCVLYFMRNHPRREWCSAGCGNRGRVARHYRRHQG